MTSHGSVDSLVNICLYTVVRYFSSYSQDMYAIPSSIKDRMLNLTCKRGLLNDQNIISCCYSSLREIDLSECEVSDSALQSLSEACQQLNKIDLNSTKGSRDKVTSVGVMSLSKGCKHLQVVYLRRCLEITDDAVISLAQNCRQLKEVNLCGCCNITDLSLEAFGANSRHLVSLNVAKTLITDRGVHSLCVGLPRSMLAELHLNQCVNLTDQAINHVVNSCPSIKILLLHGCPKMTESVRAAIDQLASRMRQVTWTVY